MYTVYIYIYKQCSTWHHLTLYNSNSRASKGTLGDNPNWPRLAIPIGKIMIDNGMLHDVWGTLFSDKPIFVQPRQPLFKRFYHGVPFEC